MNQHIAYSIKMLRKAEKLAHTFGRDSLYLAFSGGKDSQVIYHLALMAGVKFEAHYHPTTIDPPEVIRFIRSQYPNVIIDRPRMSFFDLCRKNHILPTMRMRFCCKEFKEANGAGNVVITGVRKAESTRRSQYKEIHTRKQRTEYSFDEFEQALSQSDKISTCMGKGKEKVIVMPILEWTDEQVWAFLRDNHISHCKEYDIEGINRIGCVFCPMQTSKLLRKQFERFPYWHKMLINTIKDNRAFLSSTERFSRTFSNNPDAEAQAEGYLSWWLSKKSYYEWAKQNNIKLQ